MFVLAILHEKVAFLETMKLQVDFFLTANTHKKSTSKYRAWFEVFYASAGTIPEFLYQKIPNQYWFSYLTLTFLLRIFTF